MKKLILVSIILLTFNIFAKDGTCAFSTEKNISKISWTAFKTPKKVGVGGAFDKSAVSGMSHEKLEDFILGLQFTADANSVNTNNKARDGKIYKNFFSPMKSGDLIRGFVTNVKEKNASSGKLDFQLWINGVSKSESLAYTFDKEKRILIADGTIDVLDYSMSKPLKALNNACKALHQNKTWSDVKIKLELQLAPCFQF